MAFGDLIRSTGAPGVDPQGIGGDADTIWHMDGTAIKIYELDVLDFSVVRSAGSPGGGFPGAPSCIGGKFDVIWFGDYGRDRIYEVSVIDLSTIRSAATVISNITGVGGDSETIWANGNYIQTIYELSTTDFSIIRSGTAPVGGFSASCGGDTNRIWFSAYDNNSAYKVNPFDFSVIASKQMGYYTPVGIGGDINTVWTCGENTIRELDADANVPPVADAGGPYIGKATRAVSFDGSGSTDPDGTIVSWGWDFGDSETDSGETVEHSYDVENTYTVELTVTDDGGLTDTDTTTATISPASAINPGRPPRRSTGASIPGGIQCGMGKRRAGKRRR